MKKLVLLSLLPAALTVQASEDSHYKMLDTLAESAFFSDSKLDLTAKNYWKYLKEDEAQPREVHNAWGQGFGFDYKSGYLADFIGFDTTFNAVAKLGASDYFSTRGILYNDGKGLDKDNAKGFTKFSQRYTKIKFGNDTLKFNGKYGWQILKNYGVITASNRLTQNSYLGYTGVVNYDNLSLSLGYLTSSLNRDSPDKVNFLTKNNKTIDSISTGEIAYKDKDLSISYAYGETKDYLRRHVIEMSYKPIQKLTLGGQFYGSYALDDYDSMKSYQKEFDNHAWHYATDALWKEKDWSIKLGIAYTKAEKENAVGYYWRHLGKNTRGRFNSLTSAGVDYMRDGELALTAVGTYNFIEELTTGLQINYGQFDYKDNTVRTGEINLFNRWVPTDPRLKNLSFFAMFGYGWSYKTMSTIDKTPRLSNGDYQRSPSLSGEVIIEYRFNLL